MRIGRRRFLQLLVLAPLSPYAALSVEEKRKKMRKYLITEDYVAGVRYHDLADPADLEVSVKPGHRLVVDREPSNPFDRRAVSVWTKDGKKIGYVPRRSNRAPAAMVDDGADLIATVLKVDPGDDTWRAVKIRLELVVQAA